MQYKYYQCPDTKSVIYRAEPKRRIAEERWELYIGKGKWEYIEGISAECEGGLMFGAWNDIVVWEISEQEAKYVIENYESIRQQEEMELRRIWKSMK